ncbi:DUF1778 domain-containing protein [Pasteurella atlantica]|uniref:DUF1778 domain-containing protein n=1 Tax=Pasteurella atlantica TaxID=2827233 RepID=A0AAW8CNY4_9PAST|nr:DUF1778 domain-containing protein [Pasteurella atlantica]MBR0574457.1 DUF1778 domain-containing protein [Pasteurella atlantica]MDP8032926.1 DUF1778 domain-containing protein [Pasteurella atlantica]MDP8034917.1 DUF1778 domain-containing protein [Pasteurella atlantica]MDP8036813.1 DUF1778 domain-containing protein [Pasteurella atlantica]MDP8039334.1 DUF1778 domain-containing protein [Pasteurella atlantica]
MARAINTTSDRISIRISRDDKEILQKATLLSKTTITDFVLKHVLYNAKEIVKEHEESSLSKNDLAFIMDLLDNPPAPNERLMKAAKTAQDLYDA